MNQATQARRATAQQLHSALQEARAHTLALFATYTQHLSPDLSVPKAGSLNLPLWELGHLAWFQSWWIGRQTASERAKGRHANPSAPRAAPLLERVDALFDSSAVAHDGRWQLGLPNFAQTRAFMDVTLAQTLTLLETTPETDDDLYFYRLCLFHEDMHGEALAYMARALGWAAWPAAVQPPLVTTAPLRVAAQIWHGSQADEGFTFDNERGLPPVTLAAFEIDSRLVSRREFNTFRAAQGQNPITTWPDGLGEQLGAADLSATHVSWADAQAYCAWVGRALPSEAQWMAAAATHPDMQHGQAWEWTCSPFTGFEGFSPDPYLDYSQPWFRGADTPSADRWWVLKGGSTLTRERMKHPAYRNFFKGHRVDVESGFRTCRVL